MTELMPKDDLIAFEVENVDVDYQEDVSRSFVETIKKRLTVNAAEEVIATAEAFARKLSMMIESFDNSLTQAEVTFGVKVNGEASAAIAKANAESSVNIKLVWDRTKSHSIS